MKYYNGQTIYCIGTKWATNRSKAGRLGILEQKFSAFDEKGYIVTRFGNINYHSDNVYLTEKDAEVELAARKLKENIL